MSGECLKIDNIDKNGPFCICENFITPDTEYVTAESVMRLHNRDNISLYSHYIKICEELEIKDIRDRIDEMLVVIKRTFACF